MKHQNLKRKLTVALLTSMIATAAYGQTYALTAKIPFAFRAAGSELPAGNYKIGRTPANSGGVGTMELQNMDSGKAILVLPRVPLTEKGTTVKDARLIFHCAGEEGCSLETMWFGTGGGLEFSTPPMTASQRERHETIYLDRLKTK